MTPPINVIVLINHKTRRTLETEAAQVEQAAGTVDR